MTTSEMKALRTKLAGLVELAKSNGNALEYLHTMLETTTDRFTRQQIRLAISHAEKLVTD